MLDEISTFNPEIVLYINKDSHYLDKLMLKVNVNKDGITALIDLNVAISNHNQAQNITVPEGAEDFNMMGLMGLGMMMEGSQGSSMGDDTGDMIDYSELEDMDMMDMESMDDYDFETDMDDLDAMMEGMEDVNVDMMME